jgi:hypothetical protein
MSNLRGFFIAAGVIVAAIFLIKVVTFAVLIVLTSLVIALMVALGFGMLYALYIVVRSTWSRHVLH